MEPGRKMPGKKVAILRGANLNKYEMQTYEKLNQLSNLEIKTFSSLFPEYQINSINLPNRKLLCSEDFMPYLIPEKMRKYVKFALEQVFGVTQLLVGLVKELEEFDLIHTADPWYYYSYQAAKAKDKYHSRLVVTQWGNIPFLFEHNRLTRRIKYTVLDRTDHFIAMSERARETLLLEGVALHRITVAPVGVDIERFKPQDKSEKLLDYLGLNNEDLLISFCGRLSYSKGVEFLLYAFKKLISDSKIKSLPRKIRLAFFGEGDKKGKLLELARRLDLEKDTFFLGFYPYEEMEQIYNTTDIFVLPSVSTKWWQEQLGMVLLEGMACGCAVVSTSSGSIPEVVGDAGLLCNPGDFYDLYLKIRELCLNEDLRKNLGERGRQRVTERYNSTTNAQRINDIYQSVLFQ
jgi:glycosyltransferase involved in cell wall biosynthesis